MNEVEVLKVVTALGSFGILAYLVVLGLPKLVVEVRSELALQRQECREEREIMRERVRFLEEMVTNQAARIVDLLSLIAEQTKALEVLEHGQRQTRPGTPPGGKGGVGA